MNKAPFPPVEDLCRIAHDAYEKAATENGWETQQASRVPWDQVPEVNKATMRAAMTAVWHHVCTREVEPLNAEVKRLTGWVAEVLSVHAKLFLDSETNAICSECRTVWPCRTITAMRNVD